MRTVASRAIDMVGCACGADREAFSRTRRVDSRPRRMYRFRQSFLAVGVLVGVPATAAAQSTAPGELAPIDVVAEPVAAPPVNAPQEPATLPPEYPIEYTRPTQQPEMPGQEYPGLPPLAAMPVPRPRRIVPLRTPRVVLSTVFEGVVVADSGYNTAGRLWGFGGFGSLLQFVAEADISAGRYFAIGPRIATGVSDGGRSQLDAASLSLQTFDADVVVRLGYPLVHGTSWVATPAVQLEGGVLGAWASLRGETQSATVPRFAALATFSIRTHWFGASVRAGYQHAIWPDAGGHGVDLGLNGLILGFGLEVAL